MFFFFFTVPCCFKRYFGRWRYLTSARDGEKNMTHDSVNMSSSSTYRPTASYVSFFPPKLTFSFQFFPSQQTSLSWTSSWFLSSLKLRIGRSCFISTFLGKNPFTRQTHRTFNRSRANLNGPIRNTFVVFYWNQSETILVQGSPELFCACRGDR